jgi:hypothetical protein
MLMFRNCSNQREREKEGKEKEKGSSKVGFGFFGGSSIGNPLRAIPTLAFMAPSKGGSNSLIQIQFALFLCIFSHTCNQQTSKVSWIHGQV